MNDLRLAVRSLAKAPALSAIAVLSLSLAIGAGTAVFSVANGILLRSLPVPNPHELRVVEWSATTPKFTWYSGGLRRGGAVTTGDSLPFPLYAALRGRVAPAADVFGYKHVEEITARARREAFTADGLLVTDNFFPTFGATPVLGRALTPADASPDATAAAVISFALWQREFGGDEEVLGSTLSLNGNAFTIVGVMPAAVRGVHPGDRVDFYLPVTFASRITSGMSLTSPDRAWLRVMARLRPDASESIRHAATRFGALAQAAFASAASGWGAPKLLITEGRSGPESFTRGYAGTLLILGSIVLVVVLVACANLAGLLLSRAAVREHEFAVRSALGSGRWRLARLALAESIVLAATGTGAGLVIALWIKTGVGRLLAGSADGLRYDTSLDGRVLGFAIALAVVTALLSGLVPAWQAGRVDPLSGLKGPRAGRGPKLGFGRMLVAAQIAMSVVLVSAGVLYVGTLVNRRSIELGFRADHLLLFKLNPRGAGYRGAQIATFYERVQTSLARMPGVRSVGLTQYALLGHAMSSTSVDLPGLSRRDCDVSTLTVGETLFATLGIPIVVGRGFTAADGDAAPPVAVVNQEFVRAYLDGENPVGQRFSVNGRTWEIVGVAANSVYTDLTTRRSPSVYFTFRQSTTGAAWFAVRTGVAPRTLATLVRRELATVDPNVPVAGVTTQEQLLDATVARERMFATLCGSLAVLTVLLSGIGLFGLVGYQVARRTPEIGVRMALGATPADITRPILREAVFLAGAGLLVGIPATLGLAKLIKSQLYGVQPSDPLLLGGAVLLFVIVALAAAWLPARRAAAVDPLSALRAE